jgi:hypothetical protein
MALKGRRPLVAVAKRRRLRQWRDAVLVQVVMGIDQGGQHHMAAKVLLE